MSTHVYPAMKPTDPRAPGFERRLHARRTVGMPVRLMADGVPEGCTVELRDVSATGCFLLVGEDSPMVLLEQDVALGFVLPTREVGLARGRVIRVDPGVGFAIVFLGTNEAFAGFVNALVGEGVMVA